MKTKKMNKKFSIFEMLVVLSILSILASLILGSFGLARDEAKRTKCLNNLRQIQNIVEVFRKDHRTTPDADDKGDFRFAQHYVDESTLAIFRCPGDIMEVANSETDEDWFYPILNNGTSYEFIPSKGDALNDDDFSDVIDFLKMYDKDMRFHNGRLNVLYLHGGDNPLAGIARTETPGDDPDLDPEGEGRNNHGHGNNVDGVDKSNPGKAPKVDQSTDDDEIKPAGRMN